MRHPNCSGIPYNQGDDWGKLKRVIKCLNGTKNLVLTLMVDSLGVTRWFVNVSYAIYNACKGHARSMMILGSRAVMSFSTKQKINGKR